MTKSTKRDRLHGNFRGRALEPDTLFLLSAPDALEFVEAGKALGLVLQGVEGFVVTDAGAYQPRQDFSNDRADEEGSIEQFELTTKTLIRRGVPTGIRFQVIFDEDSD